MSICYSDDMYLVYRCGVLKAEGNKMEYDEGSQWTAHCRGLKELAARGPLGLMSNIAHHAFCSAVKS